MAYQKQEWHDLPLEDTPISAERLTHMEDGIYEAWEHGGGGETLPVGSEIDYDGLTVPDGWAEVTDVSGDGYIKLPDGTLICRGTANIETPITYSDWYGFCRLTNANTVTFPCEFKDNQCDITLTSDTFGYFSAIITNITKSDFSFRACTHNQSSYNPGAGKFHYIAIGKWK